MSFRTPPAPITLSGRLVELRPLETSHHDGLLDALSEGDLWKHAWYTSVPSPEGLATEVRDEVVTAWGGPTAVAG